MNTQDILRDKEKVALIVEFKSWARKYKLSSHNSKTLLSFLNAKKLIDVNATRAFIKQVANGQ